MSTRIAIFLLLLLLSIATLLAALFGQQNRTGYAVATTVFHLFLIAAGYSVAVQHRAASRRRESKSRTTPLGDL